MWGLRTEFWLISQKFCPKVEGLKPLKASKQLQLLLQQLEIIRIIQKNLKSQLLNQGDNH